MTTYATIPDYMHVSLEQTQDAMSALIVPGKVPNGKVAFWNAALSARNKVERNCTQAAVMRSYANRPLPVNRDELKAQLGPCLGRAINALYEIEKLWNAGIIHFNCGDTFELQSKWRDSMVALIPGMGMKTVSFALHLYDPEHCKLLTIDTWHVRLQERAHGDETRRNNYLAYETELLFDCEELRAQEGDGYWLVTYAACLWERTRQQYGAGNKDGSYTDHSGLTCYI